MSKFTDDLVAAASVQLQRFAGRKETDPTVRDVLIEYWTTGAGRSAAAAQDEIDQRTAWSAAFISFVVKAALASSGSPAKFKFSGRHSDYAGAAILNLMQNRPPPDFIGLPPTGPGAVKPNVGDIIGVTRELSVDDYADALDKARAGDGYFSHFDIVTAVEGGKVACIGGNVSDSVTQRMVPLEPDGTLPLLPFKFDSAHRVTSGPYICVIKHKEA